MLNLFKQVKVRIDPIFLIVAFFIAFLNTVEMPTFNDKAFAILLWMGIIVFSILFHEYGHAFTALAFGQRAKIDLVGIGGLTQREGKKLKLWQEFLIVLNGPLCSIALAMAALFLLDYFGKENMMHYVLRVTFSINLFWTVVNLLPVQPLDGGKLLSIILESIFGFKGVKFALFLSIILAVLIGVFFFLVKFLLAGALFFLFAFESYRSWSASLSITKEDQNASLQQKLQEAEILLHEGKASEALPLLEEIRESTKAGQLFKTASQYLASILYSQGNTKAAFEILYPLRNKLDYDSLRLLHRLAYYNQNWQEAIRIGIKSYQMVPSYDTALMNALSHALQGDVQPAVGWLECAIRDGMPNVWVILSKTEFDRIRGSQEFQGLLQKMQNT